MPPDTALTLPSPILQNQKLKSVDNDYLTYEKTIEKTQTIVSGFVWNEGVDFLPKQEFF